jgi:hypothetical protein
MAEALPYHKCKSALLQAAVLKAGCREPECKDCCACCGVRERAIWVALRFSALVSFQYPTDARSKRDMARFIPGSDNFLNASP